MRPSSHLVWDTVLSAKAVHSHPFAGRFLGLSRCANKQTSLERLGTSGIGAISAGN